MIIEAIPVTPENFAGFGRVRRLGADSGDSGVIRTEGPEWSDGYTSEPLIADCGSLGMTQSGGGPYDLTHMERHSNTEEALFCAGEPVMFALAPACLEPSPDASAIRAFVVPAGTVVVLDRGVWHDACRGLSGPVTYYWMATIGTGTEWQPVHRGPVCIVPPGVRA